MFISPICTLLFFCSFSGEFAVAAEITFPRHQVSQRKISKNIFSRNEKSIKSDLWILMRNIFWGTVYWIFNAMSTNMVHFRQKPQHKNKIATLFNRGKARLKINCKLMATQLKSLPSSGVSPEERSSIESAMKADSWFPLRKRLSSSSSWFVVYELESSRDLGHILQKWSW